MIDIHTHLLPQIDDGSSDWEESLAMVRQAARDGIEGAVCSPHVLNVLDEPFESKVMFKFQQLKELIQKNGIPFKVWLGSELHCQARFHPLSRMATINGNQKYLMMELPMGELPMDAGERLFKLSLEGITPVLAHPERNAVVIKNRELVYQFVMQGVMVQINAGSLTGDFGKTVRQTAFELVDRHMVHAVASDGHSAGTRPMLLKKARHLVTEKWGKATALALFEENPRRMVEGGPIQTAEPLAPEGKRPFIKKIFGLQ
jgi:protein-tyrosine phosphatase